MFQEVQLQAHIEVRRPDRLRIDYTLTNRSDRPFYVFTCAVGSELLPLPHHFYSVYRERKAALLLHLGIPPIPAGLSVYAKIIPLCSLIHPGKSHTDYLDVPVPVPEWHPYADPEQSDDVETVTVRKILLTTEYFGGEDLVRQPERDPSGYFKVLGVPLHRVRAELEVAEPVPVLKRLDEFDRF